MFFFASTNIAYAGLNTSSHLPSDGVIAAINIWLFVSKILFLSFFFSSSSWSAEWKLGLVYAARMLETN